MRSWLPVGVAVVLLGVAQLVSADSPYFVYLASLVGVNVILAVSLNIVNGMTGQFSIGHAGFMAVGAYTAGIVSISLHEYKIGFLPVGMSDQVFLVLALLAGGTTAAICGFLVGLPSLRLKGDYLAIVTLGFGEIIRVIIQNSPSIGASLGMSGTPQSSTLFMVWFWVFVVVLLSRRLLRSPHGRSLLAIREDEVAAEAMGVDTTSYKVRAFVVSSFFAGVAGGLFGHFVPIINPGSFTFVKSIEVVVMIVAGGLGSTSGAVLAAVFLTLLPEGLRTLFLSEDRERFLGWQLVLPLMAAAVITWALKLKGRWVMLVSTVRVLAIAALGLRLLLYVLRTLDPTTIAQKADQIRMPIYGMLLVILMLTRPQGLFGTHEIWDLFKKKPAPPPPSTEAAA